MPGQVPAIVAATAFAGSAMAQQQPGRFEVMNCFGGTTAIQRDRAYNVVSLDFRGTVRAVGQQGGPLDRHASHCKALGGAVNDAPHRLVGFCEFSGSPEDRVLLEWTLEGGRGSGRIVGGRGRYKGASGDYAFTSGGPSPAPEPGVVQGCTHLTGEMRLADREGGAEAAGGAEATPEASSAKP
jgi:hypothetical protein